LSIQEHFEYVWRSSYPFSGVNKICPGHLPDTGSVTYSHCLGEERKGRLHLGDIGFCCDSQVAFHRFSPHPCSLFEPKAANASSQIAPGAGQRM
jgi:hypothetical protein